eukprot:240461-Lingulodinium_polyedra.AAC.1
MSRDVRENLSWPGRPSAGNARLISSLVCRFGSSGCLAKRQGARWAGAAQVQWDLDCRAAARPGGRPLGPGGGGPGD